MPESLLRILQFLLLLLLYLFFFRVLRAVWAEVANPREVAPAAPTRAGASPAPTSSGRRERPGPASKGKPTRLKVVEPADRKGQAFDLAEELTVGRAAGCQVRVDDTYASQLHARIFQRDGQLFVEDLGSTNGTYLNRQKVTGPMVFQRGDKLQIGNTVLELSS
jgi:pSer/pThr/pTyr-binding forkhead associated (FHA) protein